MPNNSTGLALREAVATKVMGLTCKHWPAWRNHAPAVFEVNAEGMALREVPAYESDIAAAWLVVEKMREKGFYVRIHDCYELPEWVVDMSCPAWSEGSGSIDVQRMCPTAPEAICRAALAALETK